MIKRSLFKYFSDHAYAKQFLNGRVYHQTLGFYRDYEDATAKQVIGDEFESTRIYRSENGLLINNLTQGKSSKLPKGFGFESSTRAGEIYVFCLSLSMKDELVREFQSKICIEIVKPTIFINRWRAALPKATKHFSKKVDYYKPEDVPGNVWPQPHLIATTKLDCFSYQEEYRLGFSVTEALDFEQVELQLIERKKRPSPKYDEHHQWTIELGNLSDICKLHELHT